ncbi:CorA family divalent cation transporter [Clostridium sp. Maddingley MBC34-26]|uniref:magnesium transporter CorA family protein n=1 Tax=Clostridium sp. Maddingley MBC34-26 TaxID=1196322 RepID=UPI0002980B6E|nr:CorA family divalent cation transporter [Clostridium sp. Maddingley MBC34-26]EKQ56388.1 MAG: Mg2+/Co2+ transporter [Clostridium sp. Maddingley MBC34-26]
MIYVLNSETLQEDCIDNIQSSREKAFLCNITFEQLKLYAERLNINERILYESLNGKTTKFESYEGFDYISLKIPKLSNVLEPSNKVCIFFTKSLLVFISNNFYVIDNLINKIQSQEIRCTSLSKVFYNFFDILTHEDANFIDNIEYEITELEDGLITSKDDNYLNKIVILRKKLLKLKRYYERFISIAESIEENDNELIDKKTIKYFRMFTNRINRLYEGVNNLRDYVTQVREAYQAQVDINQNTLMKLFTVVTTIFLPLSLIVGWYGMNVKMPEYGWDYSYPAIILISISIVVFCIVWFKKNKWL